MISKLINQSVTLVFKYLEMTKLKEENLSHTTGVARTVPGMHTLLSLLAYRP